MTCSFTFFVANLALADILKVVLDMPLTLISSLRGEWRFGQIGIIFFLNLFYEELW